MWANIGYYSLLSLLFIVAALLIMIVLIQKGRGGGLSSAFGGGGGSSAFGAKTGDVLTWATSIIFGLFVVLAVLLDLLVNSQFPSAATGAAVPVNIPAANQMPEPTPPVQPTPPVPSEPVPAVPPVTTAPATRPIPIGPVLPKPMMPTTVPSTLKQTIQNATTQPAGVIKAATAATQPVAKLIKGGK